MLRSLVLICAFTLAGSSTLARVCELRTKEEIAVRWKGSACDQARIASQCGETPARAVESWSAWASSHGYGMFLNDDGRVLLLLKHKKATDEMELVQRTCRLVDELVTSKSTTPPETPSTGEPAMKSSIPVSFTLPDSPVAILVQAENAADYGTVLEALATEEPYLRDWVETGKKFAGCTLVRPLCSSWIELLDGQEEWDVKNELVHRLANLLIVRSFGEQPYWLLMGCSWYVENKVRGAIYCFPYRDEFVWATEHGSWESDLKRIVKKTKVECFEKLVGWKRGSYDSDCAHLAWGVAGFLAEKHPGALAEIMQDLHALREDKGVVREGSNWQLIPGWEPSLEDQRSVVERYAGEGFLDEFVAACTKSSR